MTRSGKILYAGISDAPAWIVSQANAIAELKGWSPFVGLQIPYSLIERSAERELLPMANVLDIGVTAWSPLAGGVLTGKYSQEVVEEKHTRATRRPGQNEPKRYSTDNPMTTMFLNERNISIAQEVANVARELERSSSQVALNWVRQRRQQQIQQKMNRHTPVIIPIIGARTDFELTPDYMQRLDDVSKIPLGFPYDFIDSDIVREFIYGKTFSLIDDHRN